MLTILAQTGNRKSFDDNDLMFVLETVYDSFRFSEVIGRADISRATDIGEGVVRTIIQRLKSMNFVSVNRYGVGITETGLDFIRTVGITYMRLDHTDSAIGAYQVPLLIKGKGNRINKGIEQRNCALKIGADGCTTVIYRNGKLLLPPEWDIDEKSPDLAAQIRRYPLSEEDVILIGGSDADLRMASKASNSAALALLEYEGDPVRQPGTEERSLNCRNRSCRGCPDTDFCFPALASLPAPFSPGCRSWTESSLSGTRGGRPWPARPPRIRPPRNT